MRNTIRCCISCILPCGALDVIRIVHSNGHVEEISGTVRAAEVMRAHPKHVLKKPTSRPSPDDVVSPSDSRGPTIVVVPPDAELQRGKIYFLIPVAAPAGGPTKKAAKKQSSPSVASSGSTARRRRRKEGEGGNNAISLRANLVFNDQYLSEILSEKIVSSTSNGRERRRGRVGVWRPHLESITETLSEAASSTTTTTTDHHQ